MRRRQIVSSSPWWRLSDPKPQQLTLARSAAPEAMLLLEDNDVSFGVAHHCAVDDVLRELAGVARRGYWAVIFRPVAISLLECRSEICSSLVLWNHSGVEE